jgi:putative transposase
MREMGIKSYVRTKKFRAYRGELDEASPNILNRGFTASQANQKWVTDVTEFSVAGKKLYLSPVMDLFNGEIGLCRVTGCKAKWYRISPATSYAGRNCRANA